MSMTPIDLDNTICQVCYNSFSARSSQSPVFGLCTSCAATSQNLSCESKRKSFLLESRHEAVNKKILDKEKKLDLIETQTNHVRDAQLVAEKMIAKLKLEETVAESRSEDIKMYEQQRNSNVALALRYQKETERVYEEIDELRLSLKEEMMPHIPEKIEVLDEPRPAQLPISKQLFQQEQPRQREDPPIREAPQPPPIPQKPAEKRKSSCIIS